MEDREALKIHGYQFSSESGSESDGGKSDFDAEYFKALPPVCRIDPTKVVVLRVSGSDNSLNASNIGGSFEQVKTRSLKVGTAASTFAPCSSSSSIFQKPDTTSVKVPAASSNTKALYPATLRITDQAYHNPRLSSSKTIRPENQNEYSAVYNTDQVRSSHWKTDVSETTSAFAQNQQSCQPLLLNPATLPVNREHVRSSPTVVEQPVRNAPNLNASTITSVDSDSTDLNLLEKEDSECFSCILCLVKCCLCDCAPN